MLWKLLLLMIVLAMAGCRNSPPAETSPWVGKSLPAFSFPSIVGTDSIRSSDLHGKAALVTFWATWCPSCLQEVPILKGIQKNHGPKGLQVVALSVDKEPQLVEPLARRLGMEYQVATGAERLHMELGLAYIPHTFLLDSAGIVRASFSGGVDREALDEAIEQLGLR